MEKEGDLSFSSLLRKKQSDSQAFVVEEETHTVNASLESLLNASRDALSPFRLSRNVVFYTFNSKEIAIPFSDFLVITSITGQNVLIIGSTGSGKTTVARAYGRGVFGSDAYIQISPETDLSKMVNVDFNKMKNGDLAAAQEPTDLVNAPYVTIDELNRVNPKHLTILQEYLNNGVINLEGGKKVHVGKPIKGGRYQQKIACINVGDRYAGTSPIDAAILDRFSITVDLDNYPPTSSDLVSMLNSEVVFRADNVRKKNLTHHVIRIHEFIKHIPLNDMAATYLITLSHLSYCHRSPTGLKSDINNFAKSTVCRACPAAENHGNLCGSTQGVSNRSLIALVGLARAFAFYRHYLYKDTPLEVEIEDLMAAAEFVINPRSIIDEDWVATEGRGSYTEAQRRLLNYLRNDLSEMGSSQLSTNGMPSTNAESEASKEELLMRYPYSPIGDVGDMVKLFQKYEYEKRRRKVTGKS